MDRSQKTTILLPLKLYRRLSRLARATHTSMGRLLRDAAERQYFSAPEPQKLEMVRAIAKMQVPVGTPGEIAEEIIRGRLG